MTEPTPAKRKVGVKIFQCPWCGGDTREGEALVNLTTLAGQVPPVFGPIARMGYKDLVSSAVRRQVGRRCCGVRNGIENRLLKRSDEEKITKIYGRRCTVCGHIEFYAREST